MKRAFRVGTVGALIGTSAPLAVTEAETLRLRVNGVAMELTHARGADARAVLRAHGTEFEAATPLEGATGRWSLQSRLQRSRSIALQQRGSGETLEVLYSIVDLAVPPREPARVPIELPRGIEIGAVVEVLGAAPSRQWSLRSLGPMEQVLDQIRRSAESRGWLIEAASDGSLALSRAAERLTLLPGAAGVGRGSRLTLIAWSAP